MKLDEGNALVFALLNSHLYVGHEGISDNINVFNWETLKQITTVVLAEIIDISDITSCSSNECIYVADAEDNRIYKIKSMTEITHWPVEDSPEGISINKSHNLLVTCDMVGKVKEFTTDGKLVRVIKLDPDVDNPLHTVQLTTDQFVVCHAYNKDDGDNDDDGDSLHRVCIVNSEGKVLQSYGDKPGSDDGQLNEPIYLAVMNGLIFVADALNCRVVVLNQNLTLLKQFPSTGLSVPYKLFIDKQTRQMVISVLTPSPKKFEFYSLPPICA